MDCELQPGFVKSSDLTFSNMSRHAEMVTALQMEHSLSWWTTMWTTEIQCKHVGSDNTGDNNADEILSVFSRSLQWTDVKWTIYGEECAAVQMPTVHSKEQSLFGV